MFGLVNARYFSIHIKWYSKFPSSISLLWNLKTLIVDSAWSGTSPAEIWKIPQLRHVKFVGDLYLPDPPRHNIDGKYDDIVLANLQSLSTILSFRCSEEVIQRIPNLKKLGIHYRKSEGSSYYCLNILDRFHKLESLHWASYPLLWQEDTEFLHKLSFPHSLKKLTLEVNYVQWDDIMEKIGSLPLLEVLKLSCGSFKGCFKGGVWETVEGQFSSLQSLRISNWIDLQYWNTESTHFPCLEQLFLQDLHELKEIPSDIGEIPTLESFVLKKCSYSAAFSAITILEEQEELGNVTLQVRVHHSNEDEVKELMSVANPSFKVQYY